MTNRLPVTPVKTAKTKIVEDTLLFSSAHFDLKIEQSSARSYPHVWLVQYKYETRPDYTQYGSPNVKTRVKQDSWLMDGAQLAELLSFADQVNKALNPPPPPAPTVITEEPVENALVVVEPEVVKNETPRKDTRNWFAKMLDI